MLGFRKFLVAGMMLVASCGPGSAEMLKGSPEQTGSLGVAAAGPQQHIYTIVIDAGHGGMDPGATSHDGLREKDVVLAFASALKDALTKKDHFQIVMTREDDHFLKLEDRAKVARDHKADLFIAIHADTLDDTSVRGTTLYTLSEKASDATAEALAQKENRADAIAGMDLGGQKEEVANALIALAQRESKVQSVLFARKAVGEIRPVSELTSQPIRSAAFVVLKSPDVPSVLMELGYLSNKKDRAMLASPVWRGDMAKALANAVEAHFTSAMTASVQK
jgi:N-acetylmuramoyl-L-alanine amidase